MIFYDLSLLEKKHNIDILLAVESGSRAWGFATPDSDYDIRFVYTRKPKDYIRVFEISDVIEDRVAGGLMDVSGWDLKKFLFLLAKSNTQCYEWLTSHTTYIVNDDFKHRALALAELCFHPTRAYHSYRGMYEHHMHEYDMKKGSKNLIHALRPMLCALYICREEMVPEINIYKLVDQLRRCGAIDEQQQNVIKTFIENHVNGLADLVGHSEILNFMGYCETPKVLELTWTPRREKEEFDSFLHYFVGPHD